MSATVVALATAGSAIPVGRGEPWLEWLVFALPTLPLLLTTWFGLAIAAGVRLRERTIATATIGGVATISLISLVVLARTLMLQQPLRIGMLRWLFVPGYEIDVAFWLDPLSAVMAAMTTTIGFVVAWFSVAYLHREPGFQRYFMLVNLFLSGMLVLVLGDGFTLLFLGWEWVGLCSALLIGFFHERAAPVRAGARAFITNRFGDFGLLAASLFAAHELGGDGWAAMMAHADGVSTQSATVIGLCLWLAAMSKSAQLPFSSWMAHAVEGPTTSTGLFYGAVMAHAGVYLMLRTGPLVQHSTVAMLAMLLVGGATLIYAAAVGGAQPDAKGSIIYSTIAQLGGMFAACGLGAWHLVVVLMLLHAGLRAVQFLFAPSIIVQTRAAQHNAAIDEPAPSRGRVVHSGLIGVALLVAAWGAFGLSGVSWWYGPSGDRGVFGEHVDLALFVAAAVSIIAITYVGLRRPDRRDPDGVAARLHERALHRFDLDGLEHRLAVAPMLRLAEALKHIDDRHRDRVRAFVVAALVVTAFLGIDWSGVALTHGVSIRVIERHVGDVPWLSALWLAPVITAVVVARIHDAGWARVFASGGAALTLSLSIAVVRRFQPELGGLQFVETLPWQLLGLGYHLGVDGISATLVFVQALVVTLLLVALGRRAQRPALVSLLMLHAIGLLALISVNLLMVALVTVVRVWSASRLIVHAAPEAGARVSTKWFVRPMLASALLLLAVVLAMGITSGSFDYERIAEHGLDRSTQALAFAPFMIAVAIRLPLVPFHGWLLRLVESSPAVASVPIALAPAGHYLFLRVGLELLGDAVARQTVVLAGLAVASMLYCVLVGLAQGSLRSSLAYFQLAISSSLLVGIASADPMGPTAGVLNACNLAIAGTGLLIIADLVHARVGTTDFAAVGGLVRTAPTLTGLFLVISLAYAGFPGTLGFVAEHLASHGAFDAHAAIAMTMLAAVNLASVVLWWSFARACLGPWRQAHLAKFRDLLPRERAVLLAIAVIVLGVGWWLEPWVAMLEPSLAAHMP